jgi:hypothetical protein
VLDALWTLLGTGAVIQRLLKGRRLDEPADIWVDELEAVLRVAEDTGEARLRRAD